MTDNEIIRLLGHIVTLYAKDATTIYGKPVVALLGDVLDLIKRQQTEIERLIKVIETMTNEQLQFGFEAKSKIEQAEAEAIKEFMAKAKVYAYYIDYPTIHRVIDEEDIDNLVKEMVGE